MGFLKRNDEEEYEESDEEFRPRRKKPKDSEFKDLKPENKKKRKEPPKPWGRKERLFVSLAFFLTIGISGFLAFSSRSWKLPGLPRLKIPSISLPTFFGEETIVLEKKVSELDRANQKKAKMAVGAFDKMTENLTGIYGLYVIDFNNGFSYGVNENEIFQAASLIKLPIIAAMFMEAEEGNLDLEEKYTLKQKDKLPGAGSLYTKPPGYEITHRNLISLMGKQSDNTAFKICRKILGDGKINEVITKMGMTDTSLEENETTPYDIGLFFEGLWNGNIVDTLNRDELLDYLTGTIYEDHLAAGVPKEVRVAHKYGRELHVVNDAGIIFANEPFVVVIMSKGVIEKEADEAFPEIAKTIYDIENSY